MIFLEKILRTTGTSHEQWEDAEGYWYTHTRGNFPADESHSNLSQRAKTIEHKSLYI